LRTLNAHTRSAKLPVAYTREFLVELQAVKTDAEVAEIVCAGAAFLAEKGVLVDVLEEDPLHARIRVRNGLCAGFEGWVPTQWLHLARGFRQPPKRRR